jgi:hypothetical protein
VDLRTASPVTNGSIQSTAGTWFVR